MPCRCVARCTGVVPICLSRRAERPRKRAVRETRLPGRGAGPRGREIGCAPTCRRNANGVLCVSENLAQLLQCKMNRGMAARSRGRAYARITTTSPRISLAKPAVCTSPYGLPGPSARAPYFSGDFLLVSYLAMYASMAFVADFSCGPRIPEQACVSGAREGGVVGAPQRVRGIRGHARRGRCCCTRPWPTPQPTS